MSDFPYKIELEDSWLEFDYEKFQTALKEYQKQRRLLEEMEYDASKPIACKSWLEEVYSADLAKNRAAFWKEIDEYITKNNEKDGWTFSHLAEETVDIDNDPYDDYEILTEQYTVYAFVESTEDFKECEDYQTQYKYVEQLYKEVMEIKARIDKRLAQ